MRKILLIGLCIVFLVSLVSAITYEVVDTENNSTRIKYYSDELGKDIIQNLESIDKFDTCKSTKNDEIWITDPNHGDILNFNCSSYTNHEDYLQKKMQENIDSRIVSVDESNQLTILQNQINDLIARISILEALLNFTSQTEPPEGSLTTYQCIADGDVEECPGGISGGSETRCYTSPGGFFYGWNYCAGGWTEK